MTNLAVCTANTLNVRAQPSPHANTTDARSAESSTVTRPKSMGTPLP